MVKVLNEVTRRDAFKALAGIAGMAAVAVSTVSCASSDAKDIPASKIATDILFIEKGISYFTDNATIAGLFPPKVLSTFDAVESDINNVLAKLAASGDAIAITTAQGYVSLVAKDVKLAIDTVLALQGNGVTLPAKVITILEAVKTLIPVLETAVGIIITNLSVTPNLMTPQQARTILAGC